APARAARRDGAGPADLPFQAPPHADQDGAPGGHGAGRVQPMIQSAGSTRRGGYAHKESEETPELWFISLADLFSLLFVFFVLLTTLSAAPKNCNGLARYFEDHREQYRAFELRSSPTECVVTLPSDYLFQSGESHLQSQALSRLNPLFREIR